MDPSCSSSRVQPRQASREPDGNEPCEHIAAPRRGETFVAMIDQENLTVGSGNDRGRPLEQHRAFCVSRKQASRGHSIVSGQCPGQRSELTIMRSQHGRRSPATQQCARRPIIAGQSKERITINHNWNRRRTDGLEYRSHRLPAPPETWADRKGAEPIDVGQHLGSPSGIRNLVLDDLGSSLNQLPWYRQLDQASAPTSRTAQEVTVSARARGDLAFIWSEVWTWEDTGEGPG